MANDPLRGSERGLFVVPDLGLESEVKCLRMQASAYLLGRTQRVLNDAAQPQDDSLYVAQRLDGMTISDRTFKHSSFVNLSFKQVILKDCVFENCVFAECYFRDASFESCKFSASKFISGDLGKVRIHHTEFTYCSFDDCYIPYREMSANMPQWDNVRGHLCVGLGRQAYLAGNIRDSERYRQHAAEANEQHLWKAVKGAGSWFREHYKGFRRVSAIGALMASRARGYLWGYRRNYLTVGRNLLVLTMGIFPLLLFLVRGGIQIDKGTRFDYPELLALSWRNILPGADFAPASYVSTTTQFVAGVEIVVGLLMLGLVVSLVFRAVYERWTLNERWQ